MVYTGRTPLCVIVDRSYKLLKSSSFSAQPAYTHKSNQEHILYGYNFTLITRLSAIYNCFLDAKSTMSNDLMETTTNASFISTTMSTSMGLPIFVSIAAAQAAIILFLVTCFIIFVIAKQGAFLN